VINFIQANHYLSTKLSIRSELKSGQYRYYREPIKSYSGNIMRNTIRNTLLMTTAAIALVAGTGLASAQGMNERREAPAAGNVA
jgi:hypothetical protein